MESSRKRFWIYLGSAFAIWTLWCALMTYCGQPFSLPLVRAVVRVGAVAIPAFVYIFGNSSDEEKRFGLVKHWKMGVVVGCGVAIAHVMVLVLTRSFNNFTVPVGAAVWGNFIVFSPLAEELLFRRVAVTYFVNRMTKASAIILSAALFSLFHLPLWLISGKITGLLLWTTLGNLFLYGIVFAILYLSTKSLWASLIPHWINNFVLLGLGPAS